MPWRALRAPSWSWRTPAISDEELITWLFTPDESLRGRPIDALREGRKTEIRRRAQSLAW